MIKSELVKIIYDRYSNDISLADVIDIVDTVFDNINIKEDSIYKHCLSLVLIGGLSALQKAGGRSKTKNLNIDYSHRSNFQKLAYFGLVQNVGNREWQITTEGYQFLCGRHNVSKWVKTNHKNIVETSEEKIFIHQVDKAVQYREEWEDQRQNKLF